MSAWVLQSVRATQLRKGQRLHEGTNERGEILAATWYTDGTIRVAYASDQGAGTRTYDVADRAVIAVAVPHR